MKKLVFTISFAFITVMMYSCKESDSLTPGISQNNNNNPPIKLTPNWGIHRTWDKTKGDCFIPASNCYDDIVVRPKVMQDLIAASAGGPSAVQNYFQGSEWTEPFPDLALPENQQCLSNLQSGNYFMLVENNSNTGVNYFEIRLNGSNPEDEPTYVFPVAQQ